MCDEDGLGGDPPCWAHLFEDGVCALDGPASHGDSVAVDLTALAGMSAAQGVAWAHQSEDLDANLLVFARGDGVAPHVNGEVDVLIVGVSGDGIVEIDGIHRPLRAGQAALIAKGASRSIRGVSESFAYLSCHCRRGGMVPVSGSASSA